MTGRGVQEQPGEAVELGVLILFLKIPGNWTGSLEGPGHAAPRGLLAIILPRQFSVWAGSMVIVLLGEVERVDPNAQHRETTHNSPQQREGSTTGGWSDRTV